MAKTAIIQHDSIKNIVLELSKVLNTNYDVDNNELCFDLPKNIGDGYFRSINFDFGVEVLIADFYIKEEISLVFEKEKINPLKILINL